MDFSMGASLLPGAGDAQELDHGDGLGIGNVLNATEMDALAWLTWCILSYTLYHSFF